jgi:hypothetical protein
MITSSAAFFIGRLWKTRYLLIDVVVPRKIREVYGLLVIGKGAPKLAIVTGFPVCPGY